MSDVTLYAPTSIDHPTADTERVAILGFLARCRSPKTTEAYTADIKFYLAWLEDNGLRLFAVKSPHLEIFIREMQQRGLADATIARRYGTVALLHRYLNAHEYTPKNPADDMLVARPKIRRELQRRTYLNALEYAKVLEVAQATSRQDFVLVHCLGSLPMRVGEVCALNVESLSFEHGWFVAKYVGKMGRPTTKPIPVRLMDAFRGLAQERGAGPLFLNNKGNRMTRANVARRLDRLLEAAGVGSELTPHGLRRTFATTMLANGVEPLRVQKALEHVDLRTTMVYSMAKGTLGQHAAHDMADYAMGMIDGF